MGMAGTEDSSADNVKDGHGGNRHHGRVKETSLEMTSVI